MLDRDLAVALQKADEAQEAREAVSPTTLDDVVTDLPAFDETRLPDPFAKPPDELGRI